MNARELADELIVASSEMEYNHIVDDWKLLSDAAKMLRQQQVEIESLKLQLHTTLTNRDLRTYDGKLDIANEPVAWMQSDTLECGYGGDIDWEDTGCIPLYIHPAKTLTDEEILEIWNQHSKYGAVISVYDFAKAILRKASE